MSEKLTKRAEEKEEREREREKEREKEREREITHEQTHPVCESSPQPLWPSLRTPRLLLRVRHAIHQPKQRNAELN